MRPDVVIPMRCTGRNFIAKMRTEMPEQLVDWNTGSRFTFGVWMVRHIGVERGRGNKR